MVETDFSVSINSTPQLYPTFDSDTETPFELSTGTYTQASALSTTGITQPINGDIPEVGTEIGPILHRGGEDGPQISLTQFVHESSRDALNKTRIVAYGQERRLHQTNISRSYDSVPAGQVIRDVCNEAGVDSISEPFPDPTEMDPPTGIVPIIEEAAPDGAPITSDFQSTPAISIIEQACRQASWSWRVTNSSVWYGDPIVLARYRDTLDTDSPGYLGAPRTHRLRWIKADDTSAGEQQYPFDTIRIFGSPRRTETDGVVVENDPLVAQMQVGPDGESGSNIDGVVGRLHVYKDDRITTQRQANNVARAIWKELERQAQSGSIRCVGDPRPEPLDRVVMPDSLGGQNSLVKSVLHTISKSEGWVTEIFVGGAPNFDTMPGINSDPDLGEGTLVSQEDAQQQ